MTKRSMWKECLLAAVLACATQSVAQGTDTYVVKVPSACSLTLTTNPLQVSANTCAPVTIKCGAPDFNCSPTSPLVAVAPPLPNFPSINSTGYAYKNPGDFYYPLSGIGGCYTALTDITSRRGQSIHASMSSGGGNVMSDTMREFFAAADDSGAIFYFHGHYDGSGCLQRDSDLVNSLSGGTGGGFGFSRKTPATAFKLATKNTDGTKSSLYQENLTYSAGILSVTRTKLFDFNNAPGLDGTLTTQGGNGNLNSDYQDRFYSTSLNFPPALNGQNGAHWVIAWDRLTNMSSTYFTGQVKSVENPANGNIWGWCPNDPGDPITHGNCSQHGANPAPLALNTLCNSTGYGIHGVAATTKGEYAVISGPCIAGAASQGTWWRYGANDVRTTNTTLYNSGGHGATGFTTTWNADNNISFRSVYDLTKWTVVRPLLPVGYNGIDEHGAANWMGADSDVNPWLASTQAAVQGRTCDINPYCNELIAIKQNGTIVRFGPNFFKWSGNPSDLGPIMAMTQDGYCILFESTANGTRGLDAAGNYRKDLFSYCRTM